MKNIVLIGPMGAGKTTIGRRLAKQLKLQFIDSDHEIERRTGADIPWIFDIEGEAGFRKRERAVIDDLSTQEAIVLATGGGAVLDRRNRANLKRCGTVVYLRASVDQILKRTARSQNRPLLKTDDPRGRIEALMRERDPLYREIADITVDTDKKTIASTVNIILNSIRVPGAKRKRKLAGKKSQGQAAKQPAKRNKAKDENLAR